MEISSNCSGLLRINELYVPFSNIVFPKRFHFPILALELWLTLMICIEYMGATTRETGETAVCKLILNKINNLLIFTKCLLKVIKKKYKKYILNSLISPNLRLCFIKRQCVKRSHFSGVPLRSRSAPAPCEKKGVPLPLPSF